MLRAQNSEATLHIFWGFGRMVGRKRWRSLALASPTDLT
jgi:hypothetical protein